MIYWQVFLAFFIPNMVGYGGGPAIIPLIEAQVVTHYGWMNAQQFAEILAIGNALPSPIATKMAGYIGYEVAGVPGAIIAILATVVPSILLMLAALGLIYRHRHSPKVQRMSQWVRPVIAMMMGWLAFSFLNAGLQQIGTLHTGVIGVAAAISLLHFRIHPAFVVLASLCYGALFLG